MSPVLNKNAGFRQLGLMDTTVSRLVWRRVVIYFHQAHRTNHHTHILLQEDYQVIEETGMRLEVIHELAGAPGVTQSPQRFAFDLANAFPG